MGNPRVMQVITPSRMAGAETFLARLLRRAVDGRALHRCVASNGPGAVAMQQAGMEVTPLGIGGKANLLAVSRLRQAAHQFGATLLHSHLSTASWWCGWLEQQGGPPSIGHVHGFTSALWHRHQTHLIACSQAVKEDLIQKKIRADRISVMHCPVDPDDMRVVRSRAEIRAELGVEEKTPVVGTFAHLSVKKGYRELLEAATQVLRHLPQAQFWCCGEGPLRQELEQKAREAGIADRFKLLGFRSDVPDVMSAIDAMVLPSHREPFGLVYVEAGLMEKPVVACNAGGASEIIEPGETGLLVRPKDEQALAEAILSLLDNRGKSSEMGRRGREKMLQKFSWDAYLRDLDRLYERVLTENAPSPEQAA